MWFHPHPLLMRTKTLLPPDIQKITYAHRCQQYLIRVGGIYLFHSPKICNTKRRVDQGFLCLDLIAFNTMAYLDTYIYVCRCLRYFNRRLRFLSHILHGISSHPASKYTTLRWQVLNQSPNVQQRKPTSISCLAQSSRLR